MGAYSNFPYTNYHELNLDWLIAEMKKLVEAWEGFNGHVDATAYQSVDPEVTVTGDLQTGLTFTFGLPRGPQGTPGAPGAPGTNGVGIASATVDAAGNFSITLTDSTVINLGNIMGPAGTGLEILGEYSSLAALQAAHPVGSAGDAYLVGSGGSYTLYIWDTDTSAWVDGGSLTSPSPYTSTPAMNGTGAAGSSLDYAKGDHVHPSDTGKQNVLATGTVKVSNTALPIAGNIDLVEASNLNTINSNSLLGGTDMSAHDLGAQPEITTSSYAVTVNGASIPASSNVDLVTTTAISTINGQSLQTGANITLTTLGVQAELDDNQLTGNIKTVHGTSLLGTGNVSIPWIYYGTGTPAAGTGEDGDIYIKYTA